MGLSDGGGPSASTPKSSESWSLTYQRAIHAALGIVDAVRALNTSSRSRDGVRLAVRIEFTRGWWWSGRSERGRARPAVGSMSLVPGGVTPLV